MDWDSETLKFKFLLIGLVVFLVSGYFAWGEMSYANSGEVCDARVVRAYEVTTRGRRGGTRTRLAVEYQFKELDGTVRKETDKVPVDWPLDDSGTVRVEYIPGSPDESRLEGHTNGAWVYVFFGGIALLGFGLFQFWRFYKS